MVAVLIDLACQYGTYSHFTHLSGVVEIELCWFLAIGSTQDLRIFDLQSQQITKTFKLTGETLKDMVDRLAFTLDGKQLIMPALQ